MAILALIPGLLAAWVALNRSTARALLDVYLPTMLFFPEYYRWIAPGIPDPTFSQAAILPIVAVLLFKDARRPAWRVSFGDVCVFGFAVCVGYSEYLNAGYSEAQNLMFDMLTWVVCPYVAAKLLIEPNGLRVAFARRFAFMIFVVSVISVYEFKMGATPFMRFLGPFFPGQGQGWVTTFRYGFARIAGPYGHAILAGIVIAVGFLLQLWLDWTNRWEPNFSNAPKLPISNARAITLGILAGSVMTMCRGPWMGAGVGLAATLIGRSKRPKRALGIALATLIVVGVPAVSAMWAYASVGRANAQSESQETAAYRKELLDRYVDIAMEHATWGWGRNTWPKIESMPSIDNYYLLLSLQHGVLALGFLVALFFWYIIRLFRHELARPPGGSPSFGYTLIGVYLVVAVSIATVYLGEQAIPVLFFICGWTDGYLYYGRDDDSAGPRLTPKARFARIVT